MADDEDVVIVSPDFGPGDPEFIEKLGEWANQQTARLREEQKPKNVTFKMSEVQRLSLQGALHDAKERLGTNRNARALAHICLDYMQYGPKIRAMESMQDKAKYMNKRLEDIMREMGPTEVMRVFNRTFPAHIIDYPK